MSALLVTVLPGRALGDPPSFEDQSSVVDTFENSVGEVVYFRRGWWGGPADDRGFGFTKAFVKHNIKNSNVIRKTVREPARVEHLFGGTWKHERDVGLYEDGRLVEARTVRVLINYWGMGRIRSTGGGHGVLSESRQVLAVPGMDQRGAVKEHNRVTA